MIRKMKRQALRRSVGRPVKTGHVVTFTDSLVFKFVEGITPRGVGRTN